MNTADAVIEALERAPAIVVPLVQEVPSARLKRRPSEGKWSAHEHAWHLSFVHRIFCGRLKQMLTSPTPVITPYLPDQSDPDDMLLAMNLDEAMQSYAMDRARLVAQLRSLSERDWARTAEHGEYSH